VAKVEDGNIESFRPQRRNLNKHSQRGMGALEASMRKHGYVAPMTAAADGEIIDGSARLETVANVFEDDVLIVHHDGTKPVVMVRDDIPNASTNEARAISALANRIAEINLTWDAEELLADLQSGVDFGTSFSNEEMDTFFASLVGKSSSRADDVDHDDLWQGMPEFEHENLTAIHSIKVHFASLEGMAKFAELVNQTITDKTKAIWYPKAERIRYGEVHES
jgi:hypothetical protein